MILDVPDDEAVTADTDVPSTFEWADRASGTSMSVDGTPLGPIDLAATTFYTADLDAAIDWYDDKLGLAPVSLGKDGHRFAVFQLGAAIVVLEPIEAALEPSPPGSESTTINLVVKRDADDIRRELIANDVTCGEIVASPNFRSFLIRDLDGNRYYVAQPVT